MLRMRRITDQGFVVLAHFIEAGVDTQLTAREVSEALSLPAATTAKVLKLLQRAELLTSTRGLHGGYTLGCDPDTTTVVQVIEAFEGPLGLTECSLQEIVSCDNHDTCTLAASWPTINKAVIQALATVTLTDLTRQDGASRVATDGAAVPAI